MQKLTHKQFIEKLKNSNEYYLNGDLKVISSYNGYGKSILCQNKYGLIKTTPENLLKGSLGNIVSAVNKTQYFINQCKDKRENFNDICYKKVKYLSSCCSIKLRCKVHKMEYTQRAQHHLQGVNGCIKCSKNSVFYTEENINNFKDKSCIFYVLRLKNENEEFYKIGITSRKLIYRIKSIEKFYDIEILYKELSTVQKCYDLEQRFLKEFRNYKHTPNNKFRGYTECLSVNPVEEYFNNN